MSQANMRVVNQDMKILLKDAQTLFSDAASMTGSKADELRNKGMKMLEQAVTTAQDFQASAVASGKQVVTQSEDYVKGNPWAAVAIAAGVGALLGVIIARKG